MFDSLEITYHSLKTTSSVTVQHHTGKDTYSMMVTLCGMDRVVAQEMAAVPSTTHHGSVLNLINTLQMTLSYDCVLIKLLMTRTLQLRSLTLCTVKHNELLN